MFQSRDVLICGLLLWGSARAAPPGPAAAAVPPAASNLKITTAGRRLTGRFLHITDFHPDPYYKTYSSTAADAACHREHGPAGIYGAETSGCDSPYSLINQTFQWINDNIKESIDFVIWTGDSARHDNDEKIPRTQKQVIRQNEFMVSKFAEVFGQHHDKHAPTDDYTIPIVPTFGNNDIMPHNIFLSGPNRWTMKYLDIWRSFIPEAQRHQFQQGGWFSVEVIPGKLAVMSLNTIYFFSSNSGVDGCANKREPGYEHMEWLRIQLRILRERGMKAILMGHVPPARVDSKESWDETCWQKYTLWTQQYRDVIVGSLYGHMNIDHFMLQDFDDISKDAKKGRMPNSPAAANGNAQGPQLLEDGEVTIASASDYLLDLRQAWARLPSPAAKSSGKTHLASSDYEAESYWNWLSIAVRGSKKGGKPDKDEKKKYLDKIRGKYAERYAVTNVAPSVVPNYFPTLRIFEYNITGLESLQVPSTFGSPVFSSAPSGEQPIAEDTFSDDEEYLGGVETLSKKKKKGRKPKKPKKWKFKVPEGPSKSSPPGPAYSPQVFTWTRYVQYFANLTHINNDFVESQNDHVDSISTNQYHPHTIFGLAISPNGKIEHHKWKEGKHGKHQGKRPKPEPHPNEFLFEVEYDTMKDRGFKDLTVRRWVEYARKIGRAGVKSVDEHILEAYKDIDKVEIEENDMIDDDDQEEETETEATETGHKKHKKKKKHHASKEWFTFVKRAFVGTMDPHEIKELFGASIASSISEDGENETEAGTEIENEKENESMEL